MKTSDLSLAHQSVTAMRELSGDQSASQPRLKRSSSKLGPPTFFSKSEWPACPWLWQANSHLPSGDLRDAPDGNSYPAPKVVTAANSAITDPRFILPSAEISRAGPIMQVDGCFPATRRHSPVFWFNRVFESRDSRLRQSSSHLSSLYGMSHRRRCNRNKAERLIPVPPTGSAAFP